MTRPHDRRRARLDPRKQTLVLQNRDLRAAVLALLRGYDLPAGQPGDELHPVANAEEWNAEIQNAGIGGRGPFIEYRIPAAGEDDALGGERPDEGEGGSRAGGGGLRAHARLPAPPRRHPRG